MKAFFLVSRITDTPNNLQNNILNASFKKETDEYAIFCDLSDFQEFELDTNILVKKVKSRQELLNFIKVISFIINTLLDFQIMNQ